MVYIVFKMNLLVTENITQINQKDLSYLMQLLPTHMVERSKKYFRWQDAQAYLLGRMLLMEGFNKLGLEFRLIHNLKYTENNRPYLSNDLDFNISHSGDYVVCAIAKKRRIGVDIEKINDINFMHYLSHFTQREWLTINGSIHPNNEFYRYWTIKEAAIKADGRGLNIPLNEVEVASDVAIQQKRWYYRQLYVQHEYMLHVVSDLPIESSLRAINICLTDFLQSIKSK